MRPLFSKALMAGVAIVTVLFFVNCSSTSNRNPTESTAQREINTTTSNIDLNQMSFSNKNFKLFESSNFYSGIRTEAGHVKFINEFQTHHMIRLISFEWAVKLSNACVPQAQNDYSNCLLEFKNGLESSRTYLDHLTKLNHTSIFLVDIFRTPYWLSTQINQSGPACGGGDLTMSYRPKNDVVWKQMLQITADFFKTYENQINGPKIYYQFWNEPDLACNWQEGTAEFLQLYSNTMPYLKSIHPSSKVGGPGVESWKGRIAKDGATRPQSLLFDLIQVTKEQSWPMDYVSFHYFSESYSQDFSAGIEAIRSFQKSLGIDPLQMPIILSEWLPQSATPYGYNSKQAADAGNLYLAIDSSSIEAQGGIAFQDYGTLASDQWGLIGYDPPLEKPIFEVYKFFDSISRTSLGINHWKEKIEVNFSNLARQTIFAIGERSFVVSKEPSNCYKLSTWNRLGEADDAAIAYLIGEGLDLQTLQNNFGNDSQFKTKLTAAIRNNQPFDSKWKLTFENAKFVLEKIETIRARGSYNLHLKIFANAIISVSGISVSGKDINKANKPIQADGSILSFELTPEEVAFINFCISG